jgi:hypothetical protein
MWQSATRTPWPIAVPAAYQAAKAGILKGLGQMSAGVTEVADGLHNKTPRRSTRATQRSHRQ